MKNYYYFPVRSNNLELQIKNWNRVLQEADYIVQGHGPMFKVNPAHCLNLDKN